MTIVNQTFDLSYQLTPGNNQAPTTVNWVKGRISNGTDRTPAEKAAGLWPDHAYTANHWDRNYGAHWIVSGGDINAGWMGNSAESLGANTPLFTDNDHLLVVSRLAGKIRQHDWNAGIFVGELGKTTDTITKRVRQLARSVLLLKKGLIRDTLKALQADDRRYLRLIRKFELQYKRGLTDWYKTWLELRYAWRPLIKDVYDLSEAIRTYDKPREKVIRSSVFVQGTPSCSQDNWFTVRGQARRSKHIKATITELYTPPVSHLGLDNPVEVMWELVPLSFVADWFIPIGNYIRTRSVIKNTEGQFVTSVFHWHDVEYSGSTPLGVSIGRINPFGKSRSYSVERTIGPISVPLPVFRNPSGANPGTRCLDAIALLRAIVFK